MSEETPRLHLAQLVSMQEMNNVTWNEALVQLDAFVDLYLLGQYVNTPPSSPADGDAYIVGGTPTGAWSGYAYKIASCIDGAWRFYTPFNGLRAYVATTGAFIVYVGGTWTDWNSLISANEASIASAATCDLGAAGSLFVQITGTTTITSFGTGANKLRFVRFAQALTLTHNATSLILLGGASRTTAAGDVGLYASDASGNWRERSYFQAASNAGDYATKTGTETLTNKTLGGATFTGAISFPSGAFTSGGALGVGTANPTVPLQVVRGTAGTMGFPYESAVFEYSGDMKLGIYTSATALGTYGASIALGDCKATNTAGYYPGFEIQYMGGVDAAATSIRINYIQRNASGTVVSFLADIAKFFGDGHSSFKGALYPAIDNSYSFGSASLRWSVIYSATGTINTSGAATKTNVGPLSQSELAVARALAANVRVFQFCDAVAKKGEAAARLHVGMIYEDVVAAFAAHGLDPERYGIACKNAAVKKVTKTRTVQRAKMQSVTEEKQIVTMTDGVAVLTTASETREQPLLQGYPLVNAGGEPVADPATGEQIVHFAPVTEDVEEIYTEEEPDLDETGAQKWTLGLRYGELAQFVMAGLAARIAVLEEE